METIISDTLHEGSLAMTTNASGTATGSNTMSPYGETLSSTTSDPYAYAGLYQDTEYGGDAAWFRNYSAEQSRWTRPDPYNGSYNVANPQSMNRYVYAMNNPLGITDPSGLDCVYDEGGGTVAIVTGDCYSSTDNGYYIDGTINTSSGYVTLNPDGSLNFGITSPDGAYGVGAIPGFAGNVSDASAYDPWYGNTALQQILQGPGSGVFVGADKFVHGLAIATAAYVATPFAISAAPAAVSATASAAEAAPGLAGQALYNPAVWQGANDFLEGYAPVGPFSATPAAFAGAVASSWDTIWNNITRRW